MLIVWLWTLPALLGGGLSAWNIVDAHRDIKALVDTGRNGAGRLAAHYLRNTEVVRGVQFVSLFLVGVAAIAAPYLPASWQHFIGVAIGWVLVGHVWLLFGNSAQSTLYRRAIRQKKEAS